MVDHVKMSAAQQRIFASGYATALDDILEALEMGGEEAARDWIRNNSDQRKGLK